MTSAGNAWRSFYFLDHPSHPHSKPMLEFQTCSLAQSRHVTLETWKAIFTGEKASMSFTGTNGQGKTNWLEAIHLLAHAKSFRTRHLHDAIAFGKSAASIQGRVSQGEVIERDLRVDIKSKHQADLC